LPFSGLICEPSPNRTRPKASNIMLNRTFASLILVASACAAAPISLAQSGGAPLSKPQQPIAAEKNPPGDIPDNQVFVAVRSPLGFSIQVPEGWARREWPGAVSFSDKYNSLQVAVTARAAAPTLASLKANEVAVLEKSPKAIRVASVQPLMLPAGPAFVVRYGANSDRNPVNNKAIRLDNASYYFWKAGKLATLTVSAPAGADNADQWQLMAKSFAWQ
jgi:hypothetical protein